MTETTFVLWGSGVVAFAVLAAIATALARAAREGVRIKKRIALLADGPPGIDPTKIAADVARLQLAAGEVAPLIARMESARAVIRAGPRLLPTELPAVFAQLARDIAWLRNLAR